MENQKNNPPSDEKNKKIDFIQIFKDAGLIIWKNRYLLWFGVLIALGSPSSINYSTRQDEFNSQGEAAKTFLASHWQIAIFLAVLALAIGVILFLISLVAKAGLIKSIHNITTNQRASFKDGWKSGKKYLKNLFKLFVLFFFGTLAIVLVLAVPVIVLIANHSWVGAILVGLLAIAILVPVLFVLVFTNIFAEFYIVLSDLKVWSAVEAGYGLLVKNLGNALIFSLLLIALNIILGIIILSIMGISALVLLPAGILFFYLNKVVFGIYLILAILLFVAFFVFLSAIFNTYKTTAWTLFFKEIAQIKKEEPEAILKEEVAKPIAATPEKA